MADKNFFGNFVNDEFTTVFLDSIESIIKYNTTAIYYRFKEVKDSKRDEKTRKVIDGLYGDVMNFLFPINKMIEIRAGIANAFPDEARANIAVVKLDDFMSDLIKRTKKHISAQCRIEYNSGESCLVDTDIKYLNLILLTYIRKSVTDGAKEIDAAFSVNDKNAVISFSVREINSKRKEHFEHTAMCSEFTLRYFENMAGLWASKINAEVTMNGSDMQIKLPLFRGDVLHSDIAVYSEDALFNIYNFLLSDLSNA